MSDHFTWNYWCRSTPFYKTYPYPNDLDDSVLVWTALFEYNPELFSPKILSDIVKVLISVEIALGGPYNTWLTKFEGKWRDIDVDVNANVLYFQNKLGIVNDNLRNYVQTNYSHASKYYTPFYSKFVRDRALGITRTVTSVPTNTVWQPVCRDPNINGVKVYSGNPITSLLSSLYTNVLVFQVNSNAQKVKPHIYTKPNISNLDYLCYGFGNVPKNLREYCLKLHTFMWEYFSLLDNIIDGDTPGKYLGSLYKLERKCINTLRVASLPKKLTNYLLRIFLDAKKANLKSNGLLDLEWCKSRAYLIVPIIVLFKKGALSRLGIKSLTNFFRFYVKAKKTLDNMKDWYKDSRNDSVYIYWRAVVPKFLKETSVYIKTALSIKHSSVNEKYYLHLVRPLALEVIKVKKEQNSVQEFSKKYFKLENPEQNTYDQVNG